MRWPPDDANTSMPRKPPTVPTGRIAWLARVWFGPSVLTLEESGLAPPAAKPVQKPAPFDSVTVRLTTMAEADAGTTGVQSTRCTPLMPTLAPRVRVSIARKAVARATKRPADTAAAAGA